jgi:hypothetical protein
VSPQVTETKLNAGDPNCPNGGMEIVVYTPAADGGPGTTQTAYACNGSGGSQGFSIGGTVNGLLPGYELGVEESLPGNTLPADTLTVSANGNFTFPTLLTSSTAYAVTTSPPNGVSCTVANGSGVVSEVDVTNIAVTCECSAGTCASPDGGTTCEVFHSDGPPVNLAPGFWFGGQSWIDCTPLGTYTLASATAACTAFAAVASLPAADCVDGSTLDETSPFIRVPAGVAVCLPNAVVGGQYPGGVCWVYGSGGVAEPICNPLCQGPVAGQVVVLGGQRGATATWQ